MFFQLLNFNHNHQQPYQMFRSYEKESIEKLWGVKLPDIKPFLPNSKNNGIPNDYDDQTIMNLDFEFTDKHYSNVC